MPWAVYVAALLISGYVTGLLPVGLHFTLNEATTTSKASRLRNLPGPVQLVNIVILAVVVLDPLRLSLGKAVNVNSWFRSAYVNRLAGGVSDSFHMDGSAADVYVEGMTSQELADYIDGLGVPYTELGVYTRSKSGRVHIAYRLGKNDRQRYTKDEA